jgi:hypothetical protein
MADEEDEWKDMMPDAATGLPQGKTCAGDQGGGAASAVRHDVLACTCNTGERCRRKRDRNQMLEWLCVSSPHRGHVTQDLCRSPDFGHHIAQKPVRSCLMLDGGRMARREMQRWSTFLLLWISRALPCETPARTYYTKPGSFHADLAQETRNPAIGAYQAELGTLPA